MGDSPNKFVNVTRYLPKLSAQKYRDFRPELYKEIDQVSKEIKGSCVVHIAGLRLKKEGGRYVVGGGGLSEILKSHVPLENSIGLKSRLFLASLPKDYYIICRKIFDRIIQKETSTLSKADKNFFRSEVLKLRECINSEFERQAPDIIVVHDFEYLPIVELLPQGTTSILHWHVDFPPHTTDIANFLKLYIQKFDQVVTHSEVIAKRLRQIGPNVKIIYPSINPLIEKNKTLDKKITSKLLRSLGINPSKPIIIQVGRFTSQKDPLKAIRIYLSVKQFVPNAQLVLVGLFNFTDDLDTQVTLHAVKKQADKHRGILVFSDLSQIKGISNDRFINALYTTSYVILSMGKKEAFSIVILEAMWKGKVVVAKKAPGPVSQIMHGKDGFIVSSVNEAVTTIKKVLKDTRLKNRIGRAAHESIKRNYLNTRYLSEVLSLYNQLLNKNN